MRAECAMMTCYASLSGRAGAVGFLQGFDEPASIFDETACIAVRCVCVFKGGARGSHLSAESLILYDLRQPMGTLSHSQSIFKSRTDS